VREREGKRRREREKRERRRKAEREGRDEQMGDSISSPPASFNLDPNPLS